MSEIHMPLPRLRQKKLSRAIQIAVLSMSVSPTIVLADVILDEGSGAAASALTTITNTEMIAPTAVYLNVEANTQLTGPITNSGTIPATDVFGLDFSSITNSGTIMAGGDVFLGCE
jgi:hypothetical protein